jgi:hypothetical protein
MKNSGRADVYHLLLLQAMDDTDQALQNQMEIDYLIQHEDQNFDRFCVQFEVAWILFFKKETSLWWTYPFIKNLNRKTYFERTIIIWWISVYMIADFEEGKGLIIWKSGGGRGIGWMNQLVFLTVHLMSLLLKQSIINYVVNFQNYIGVVRLVMNLFKRSEQM